MDIIDRLERNGYAASDTQVAELAKQASAGLRAGSTYLRVLVARVQKANRKGTKAADVLEAEHKRLYAVVQTALAGPGVERAEKHRRCIFARTSAAALRAFIAAGGNVRKLKVAAVTKRYLRTVGAPKESNSGPRPVRSVARAQAAILRSVDKLAAVDSRLARTTLQEAISVLQFKLDGLSTAPVAVVQRARVSVPAMAAH